MGESDICSPICIPLVYQQDATWTVAARMYRQREDIRLVAERVGYKTNHRLRLRPHVTRYRLDLTSAWVDEYI